MANLTANNAAGGSRAGSFAYFGAGTGTSPLPIYLAYLNGSKDSANPAAYTGGTSTWASTTLAGRLVAPNPNPTSAASDLDGTASRRTNAATAGYPANFFVLNPAVNQANVTDSGAFSDYHALQIELRRRLSKGLSANVNYQYAFTEGGSAFDGFSYGRIDTSRPANVRHALKFQADWTLPVGRGQRYGADMNRALDVIVGRLEHQRGRPHADRAPGLRQRAARRHDREGTAEASTSSTSRTNRDDRPRRKSGCCRDDVILNTRRACTTSTTTVDGYSTTLGAPTGKYIAPANSASCSR